MTKSEYKHKFRTDKEFAESRAKRHMLDFRSITILSPDGEVIYPPETKKTNQPQPQVTPQKKTS